MAAGCVVARVLQDDCRGARAAEVSDRANLRIHFDTVHIGQRFVLVPVETDALPYNMKLLACGNGLRARRRGVAASAKGGREAYPAFYLH